MSAEFSNAPGAEDEDKQADAPMRLEGEMRVEPMVAQRDAEAAGREEKQEEHHLKPIQAEVPEVSGDGGERDGRACR